MENRRYSFVGYYGHPRGIRNTDDLEEAIELAIEFQCEVIDTWNKDNPIVFSVWDGWNIEEGEENSAKYKVYQKRSKQIQME